LTAAGVGPAPRHENPRKRTGDRRGQIGHFAVFAVFAVFARVTEKVFYHDRHFWVAGESG